MHDLDVGHDVGRHRLEPAPRGEASCTGPSRGRDCPAATRVSTRCEPMNPSAPVTAMVLVHFDLCFPCCGGLGSERRSVEEEWMSGARSWFMAMVTTKCVRASVRTPATRRRPAQKAARSAWRLVESTGRQATAPAATPITHERRTRSSAIEQHQDQVGEEQSPSTHSMAMRRWRCRRGSAQQPRPRRDAVVADDADDAGP